MPLEILNHLGGIMNEHFLQYVWSQYIPKSSRLKLIDGTAIEILDPGFWNKESGPDFSTASIKVGKTIWVGNIEVHIKSSDWYKHKHHQDPAYQNIILHAVHEYDQDVFTPNGSLIPTLLIPFHENLWKNYSSLLKRGSQIKCCDDLGNVDKFKLKFWLGRMAIERLQYKSTQIESYLKASQNDWENAMYLLIARTFGLNLNSLPFEMLARSLPYKIPAKHRDKRFQLEALFFGQSGLLNLEFFGDTYFEKLRSEYIYLKKKYSLRSMPGHVWKFSKLRPASFPTIRLAQFVRFIEANSHLLDFVLSAPQASRKELKAQLTLDNYWDGHFRFNKISLQKIKSPGNDWWNKFYINAIAPALFCYGQIYNRADIREQSIAILESTQAENNYLIRTWKSCNMKPENAYESQALIHLFNEYCSKNNCIHCQIGDEIIRKKPP